jgi:pyruvate, water dikinase
MHIQTLFKYWTYRLFAPGVVLRQTYEAFRRLLSLDSRSHELMADLEALYYQGRKEDFCRIASRYANLAESVGGMVESLQRMAPGSFVTLGEYFRKFDFYNRLVLAPPTLRFAPPFVLPLEDDRAVQADLVGTKAARLAELAGTLQLPVPRGLAITTNSLNYLLEYNDLRGQVNELLARIDPAEPDSLAQVSKSLMDLIMRAEVPADISDAIHTAHKEVFAGRADDVRVAVRSSAVNEDGECSFAGQYATVLDVPREQLLEAYLTVLASKYTQQALFYRIHTGLSDEETAMAALVVEMVDARTSGVVYTISPASKDTAHLFIHAVKGLGENLVGGRTIPEITAIEKDGLVDRKAAPGNSGAGLTSGLLTPEQATMLAGNALKIESRYQTAQDIEWALTEAGEFFFLQSRPLHAQPASPTVYEPPEAAGTAQIPIEPLLHGGTMAAQGQACGAAYCIDRNHPPEEIPAGAILVIRETLADYVLVLDRARGVLAELGSSASHLATVCREFNIPLLCGLGENIRVIRHGETITMQAESKSVYQGDRLSLLGPADPLHESQKHLPYFQKLRRLLDGITPLHLTDPKARGFAPESCRSLHDIIRFCHEHAVRIMFSLEDRLGSRSRNRRKLLSELPFDIFAVDVGGGLDAQADQQENFRAEEIRSVPFLALWSGLNHPSVRWPDRAHFDWKNFGELVMADGIPSTDAPEFASYAILGADYTHLIMRFGYHFTLVDVLCGEDSANNYCQFRFAGGGADFPGRLLRLDFISKLLNQEGFQIEVRGDLLDARLSALPAEEMKARLRTLGRLLGATRLMDMTLRDQAEVQQYVQDFLAET